MRVSEQTRVGVIAAEHPLASRVFARYGIDFCCGGAVSLAEACSAKDLKPAVVLAEIEQEVADSSSPEVSWEQQPTTALIEHILERFHRPLKEELPRLEALVRKVLGAHGDEDLALQEILEVFLGLRADLEQHMLKEEQILFPMILDGCDALAGPISVMETEHHTVGTMLIRLRTLTKDYRMPAGACNAWRALWAGLGDLERSLHEHIHLENNILHKRALTNPLP